MPRRIDASQIIGRPVAISSSRASDLLAPRGEQSQGGLLSRFRLSGLMGRGAEAPANLVEASGPHYASAELAAPVYEVTDGIAILRIHYALWSGEWMSPYHCDYGGLALQLRTAIADDQVKGILLDIDSPGGLVDGLFDLVDLIYELRGQKPIWTLANEIALSAAYAIASATDRIVLPRTAEVGSIGVVMLHFDESAMLEKHGIAVTAIYSGKRKIDGAWFQALTSEAQEAFQNSIDETRKLFMETVARNRGLTAEAVYETEAATYRGEAAVEIGLADDVMSDREAFAALKELVSEEATGSSFIVTDTTKESSMSIKKKVAARKKALKPSAEGNETDDEAEDQNEDEAAEGQDDDQAAEGSDDDDQSAEGQDEDQAAEVSDDEEQAEGSDDEEEAEGSDDEESASSERSRIAAILQSDAAKGRTSLAQHLALNTATSVKDAVAMLKASPKGGNSLSAEMAGNEIPDLGGDAPEGRKSGLAARVKARTKRLSKRS